MILTYNKRLDLKQLCIDKLESTSAKKFPILKTNKIYFEKPIGEITAIQKETGNNNTGRSWNILIRSNGTRVFPRAVDGKYLIQMIAALQSNKFFGYIEHEGQKCKVKPKIRNA
jgi:hypothetical protein